MGSRSNTETIVALLKAFLDQRTWKQADLARHLGVSAATIHKRLNVALSRAESLAIVVGCPQLARTRVTSVEQMKLVNLFCRVVSEGTSGRPLTPASPDAAEHRGTAVLQS